VISEQEKDMGSDISRYTFERTKHFSQVVMQQGRVQLDADWNEQQDILKHRIETQTVDLVGQNGVPQIGGGFKVTFTHDGNDLLISPGRIYVDGIMCELDEGTHVAIQGFHDSNGVKVKNLLVDGQEWEKGQWVILLNKDRTMVGHLHQIANVLYENDTDLKILIFRIDQANPVIDDKQKAVISEVQRVITYTTQPNYPYPTFTAYPGDLPKLAFIPDQALILVYLDVWQRTITALDDAHIREVALDGPDTSTRIQTLWQVRIMPLTLSDELQRQLKEEADKSSRHIELEADLRSLQAHGHTQATASRIKELEAEQKTISDEGQKLADEIVRSLSDYECNYISDEWKQLLIRPTGKLNVTTYDALNQASSGYVGLQNQLYHVEIHEAPNGTPVSFKWARDNASIVSMVKVKANIVIVPGTGQGGIHNFYRGQFVEAIHEQTELNAQPGKIAKITRVDTLTNQLTLDSSLGDNGDDFKTLKIRLWDGKVDFDKNGTARVGEWILVDGGIKIQFSEGTYKSGDYWLIPARTSTKEVYWPPYEIPNTHPIPQSRHGVQHHYCRLSRVRLFQGHGQRYNKTTHDCRRRFIPLPDVIDAMHVDWINWNNDSINPRHTLKNGLQIYLSQIPDQQYPPEAEPDLGYPEGMAEDSVIVTTEVHLPGGTEGIFVIDGICEIKSNVITWHWNWDDEEGVIAKIFKKMDRLGHRIFDSPRHFIRVRVRLKGNTIWRTSNGRRIYLDGQAFAMPGGDRASSGRRRTRTKLHFPSGAGLKASDFESWFYIKE